MARIRAAQTGTGSTIAARMVNAMVPSTLRPDPMSASSLFAPGWSMPAIRYAMIAHVNQCGE